MFKSGLPNLALNRTGRVRPCDCHERLGPPRVQHIVMFKIMKLRDFFKPRKKKTSSAISQIFSGKEIPWDHPNVVHLASEIVSEFGAQLEKTSNLILGVSEEHLPYSKDEVQKAIEILLRFLNNQNSWKNMKEKYPDLTKTIITNEFYGALRVGYIELAKFIANGEADICEKAAMLLSEPQNQGKSIEDVAKEINTPWFEKAIQINRKIVDDSSLRFRDLQENFGKENFLFKE